MPAVIVLRRTGGNGAAGSVSCGPNSAFGVCRFHDRCNVEVDVDRLAIPQVLMILSFMIHPFKLRSTSSLSFAHQAVGPYHDELCREHAGAEEACVDEGALASLLAAVQCGRHAHDQVTWAPQRSPVGFGGLALRRF